MEASTLLNNTNTIANSTGTGGNYNASDPVVHLSFSEAEKRMKKLERDYQHTYKNYKETRLNWHSFYIKGNHSSYRSWQAVYCIGYYQDLREQLQNDLEKLNKAEATQRRTEKPDYCKQFLLHGCNCKSLDQGKRILPRIRETKQQHLENSDLVQKRYWEINNFSYNQSKIPKSSSSKGVHALLRRFKDTVKLRGKVTASGELVENPTTQDSLTISIKILTKAIKKLEKDRERETMIGNGYEEQKRRLDKKSEWIWRKCDEQKKSILELKKVHKDVCSKLHAQFIDDDKRLIWRKIY
ncbi:hypothetical protein Bca52824_000187 [Brassica carinata]|uniref:Uncharacterized protein n=1 Tax=Brassica carinata TaxID=52824 RepID=A0A8X8BCK0_BRACI|nr:hypothetical protein Bca52824_000187 [Brassica carinata]